MSVSLVLENVVIRYPHLDAPWSGKPTITPDYNCQVIFPSDWPHWSKVQAAVEESIQQKCGANVPVRMKLPWLNKYLQPYQQKEGPYVGCYTANAVGKGTKPECFDQNVQKVADLQLKEVFFSGCIVNIQVSFGAYVNSAEEGGVGMYFRNPSIQLVNNQVERIQDASAQAPEDVFKAVPGAPAATAPVPGAVPGGNPWE